MANGETAPALPPGHGSGVPRSAYNARPSGRRGREAINLCSALLRSLFASFCFRLRKKRALSPLSADMLTQEYQDPPAQFTTSSGSVLRIEWAAGYSRYRSDFE